MWHGAIEPFHKGRLYAGAHLQQLLVLLGSPNDLDHAIPFIIVLHRRESPILRAGVAVTTALNGFTRFGFSILGLALGPVHERQDLRCAAIRRVHAARA